VTGPDDRAVTQFAQGLYLRGQSLDTFAARGVARYRSGAENILYNFELIAQRPDSYYCTFFDPLGRPAFRVVNQKGVLRALDYGEKIFYEAKKSDKEVSDLLPIPLTNRDFLDIFSASLPYRPALVSQSASLGNDPQSLISYQADVGSAPVTILVTGGPAWNIKDALVLELTRGRVQNPDYKAQYSSYNFLPLEDEPDKTFPFPGEIILSWSSFTQKTLTVTMEEIRLGVSLPQGFFTLEKPQGFTLEKI
jgi:hypothetical protein